MKLYNSMGPNPHVVRMYAAELGVELEMEDIDLMAGDNRKAPYLNINPAGQLPCLQTDTGDIVSEVTAICEYLDECSDTTLMGDTPAARANTRMWTRRVDLNICEPLANGFRYSEGLAIFKDRMITIPEAADGLKQIAREKLAWLDGLMADGRGFIAGDALSLADVLLFCMLKFGQQVGQPYDESLTHVHAWFGRMASRPSAAA